MAIPGIQEIQSLATKYSKAQLKRMAQMGAIDPTKAVMAGMMIDRIQKQNMQAPQQTVAEEIMGEPPAQAQQMQEPPPGIAGLPSGMPEQMAGGGIVAFADGGDTENYAGGGAVAFADRGLVPGGITDVIDPGWRNPKTSKRGYSDDDKFAVLAERLAELTAAERSAQGEDKARIQKDMGQLRGEMSKLRPSQSASGLMGLIPSAQAAEPAVTNAPLPINTLPSINRPKSSRERLFEQQVMEEYGIGPQTLTPEQKKASEESAARATERIKLQEKLRGLEGGFFSQKPMTDEQAAEAERLRQQIENVNKLPPIAAPKPAEKKSAAPPPTTFEPKVEAAPTPEVPTAKPEMGPPTPSFADRLLALQAEVPEGRDLESFTKQRTEAEAAAGVDPQLFDKLRQDLAATKGSLKDRADKAAGHALMMFGAGLLGGRRGQEFQNASKAAQQSLMMYMSSMDKITENEDKLNSAMRELAVSENQYKRSGAEKDLARMEKHQDKIDAINLKNTEIKAKALESLQKAAVDEIQAKNPALWTTLNNIAEEQRNKGNKGYTTLDALRDYQGTQKSGELNRGALFAIWSKMDPAEKFAYKNDFEQFMRQYQGNTGGGGKAGVKFLGYE